MPCIMHFATCLPVVAWPCLFNQPTNQPNFKQQPPVTRDVLVTLSDNGHNIVVSNMQRVRIMSSTLSKVPYVMRPQGPLDENA